MGDYAEYKTNLYTNAAMGCVTNSDSSNVYADRIPLQAVRARFESERVEILEDGYWHADGVPVRVPESAKSVRISDGRVHGTFGADSASSRRQYGFLTDLAAGVTSESPGDLRVTAAGTTRNGGRAYLQISSADMIEIVGMSFSPFYNFGMSHDGSLSVCSVPGTLVIACANMIAGIFGSKKIAKGARTKQTARITDLAMITRHKIALGLEQQSDSFTEGIKAMAEIPVSVEAWNAFRQELFPLGVEGASKAQETRNENGSGLLNTIYTTDHRAAPWHGTVLGALQAVNTYDVWERGTRGNSDVLTRQTDEFLSGRAGVRENDRAETLARVLATV